MWNFCKGGKEGGVQHSFQLGASSVMRERGREIIDSLLFKKIR